MLLVSKILVAITTQVRDSPKDKIRNGGPFVVSWRLRFVVSMARNELP